ncbi:MAG: bifunctional riboflavin kinase/FAD synthetase [Lachnospiraceae bacterium]|nr:bifunctional riboflavin kinase/FAD synthetase [Lachnospiraceae bacterium]
MVELTYDEAQLYNTAVALGKFQGLHKGHLLLIEKILSLSKNEGLNSVVFTIDINNSKMINTKQDRKDILEGLNIDTHIECMFTPEFAAMQPYEFVKNVLYHKLGAKYVVVGTDFCFGSNREGNVDTLKSYEKEFGYKVIAIKKLSIDDNIISSSIIRELIENGDMEAVQEYMGRPYFIQGIVRKGRMLGRTIDFPTTNLYPPSDKLLPPFGAYETRITISDKCYKAITNIGNNPTISEDNRITVETHIINFDGDLYDNHIKVDFVRFIREQKRFMDVSELREQLLLDKASVMHQ